MRLLSGLSSPMFCPMGPANAAGADMMAAAVAAIATCLIRCIFIFCFIVLTEVFLFSSIPAMDGFVTTTRQLHRIVSAVCRPNYNSGKRKARDCKIGRLLACLEDLGNYVPVTRPLNVGRARIGGFAAGVGAHVDIFEPESVSV